MRSTWMICLLLAISGFSLHGEKVDRKGAFSYYQASVSHKETGAYEWNGLLFIHVRRPLDRTKESVAKVRTAALLQATQILRRWALERTASYRIPQAELTQGLALVRKLLAQYDATCEALPWEISVTMREVPEKVGLDSYSIGQVFEIGALEATFPESFKTPLPQLDWESPLAYVVRRELMGEHRRTFLIKCGALDGVSNYAGENDVRAPDGVADEYRMIVERLKQYRSTSGFCAKVHDQMERVRHQGQSQRVVEIGQEPTEALEEKVFAKTNFFSQIRVLTNVVDRDQTAHEQRNVGVSDAGRVKEQTVDEAYALVETRIERVRVMTTTSYLHRVSSSICGEPTFQELFLGISQGDLIPQAQRPFGVAAVKAYFSTSTFEEKVAAVESGLADNPHDAELWNLYGRCQFERCEYNAALICFRTAVRLNGDYEYAWTNLAETYAAMGMRGLSMGAAVIACGVSCSEWCKKHSRQVLLSAP